MPDHKLVFTQARNYRDIADAIRRKRLTEAKFSPPEMAAAIDAIRLGIPVTCGATSPAGEWQRPSQWPDLSQIPIDHENEEVAYYTLDNTKQYTAADYCWIGLHLLFDAIGATATLQRGTVAEGVFTPTAEAKTVTCASVNTTYHLYDAFADAPEPFPVYRLTTNGGHLRECLFNQIAEAVTGLSHLIYPTHIPCVERAGSLPYLTGVTATSAAWNAARRHGTMWLQRDALRFSAKTALKSLQRAWFGCYNLQSLDLSGWDTSGWAITTLENSFGSCYSLQSLDLSGWDTRNWAVTTLLYAFNSCYSLQSLDLSGWDTRNWAVTTLSYAFQNCYSLQSLDLSGWDTRNWAVTTLSYAFQNCYSLQSLDLSGWDTRNWAVTTLLYAFNSCYSLQSLDLSGWDTSKWSVASLQSAFQNCYSLQSLDLSGWDTRNWAVTTLLYAFNSCYSLQSLDLSGWDTRNWAVTTVNSLIRYCRSLRKCNLSGLDLSKVTTANGIQYAFSDCPFIEDFAPPQNLGVSFSVNATHFTAASVKALLEALPTVSGQTLTISTTAFNRIAPETLAIATAKGWTIAAS